MTLGKNIRNRRQDQGLNQSELAKMAKISVSYLSEIENERINPSSKTLLKIAKALKVNISDLVQP
ncbi:MAG: helix-turn-helix transcriptional regulator [Peptococcaceae bacterium]|nr:helix-turn-helix transcriptional regulator [Peptococcaceae bacterium]